jgi:uncharacterized protein YukE
MDISVKHGEVRAFAGNLNQWAQQMRSTRNNILARTHQLETQWKDPQYRTFVDIAKSHGTTLGLAIDQFEKMSKELMHMAADLERTQQLMQQRLRNMR